MYSQDGLDPPKPKPTSLEPPDPDAEVLDPALISPMTTTAQERINTESLNLLSNVAVNHIQQQGSEAMGPRIGGGDTPAIGWSNGDGMFLSPCDSSIGGMPSDNFETDLSEFLQGHVHLGLMEGW